MVLMYRIQCSRLMSLYCFSILLTCTVLHKICSINLPKQQLAYHHKHSSFDSFVTSTFQFSAFNLQSNTIPTVIYLHLFNDDGIIINEYILDILISELFDQNTRLEYSKQQWNFLILENIAMNLLVNNWVSRQKWEFSPNPHRGSHFSLK